MKVYCEHCGHSINFLRNHFAICHHCGKRVYPTKKSKFIGELQKAISNQKKKG